MLPLIALNRYSFARLTSGNEGGGNRNILRNGNQCTLDFTSKLKGDCHDDNKNG